MSINEVYYTFTLLINKNSERRNIQIDKGNFIILYNREAKRWLAEFIEKNNNSDNIHSIAELVVNNYSLIRASNKPEYTQYLLPEDYFSLLSGNSYSKVKKGDCTSITYNYFKKPNDFNIQMEDKFFKPSFEWERGFGEVYSTGVTLYKDNFDIVETYITYYRLPKEVDMEGYVKVSGELSQDIDPDISNYLVNQILDRVVVEIDRQFSDVQKFQLDSTRKEITL